MAAAVWEGKLMHTAHMVATPMPSAARNDPPPAIKRARLQRHAQAHGHVRLPAARNAPGACTTSER